MRYILALLALGIATALQANLPSGSIDDFITSEMPISGAPGLAYAIVEDGVIHADARGEMLIGSGRKVTPDTPFVLGSISKSFTAMAVMQLVEAGKVDLDTGISHYLDVFSGRLVRRNHNPPTAEPHKRLFNPAGQPNPDGPDPKQGRAIAPGETDCAMASCL